MIQSRLATQSNYAPGTFVRRPVSRVWETNQAPQERSTSALLSKEPHKPRFMPPSMASRPPLMKNVYDKLPNAYFNTPSSQPKKIAIMSQQLYDKIQSKPVLR